MDRLHVRKLQSTAFDACAVYISVMDLEGEEIDIPSLIITKGFLISEYENSYDFIVESACTSLLKQFKLVGKLTINTKELTGILRLTKASTPSYDLVIILSESDCLNVTRSFTECSNSYWSSVGLPSTGESYSPKELNSLLNKNGKDTSSKWEHTDIKELEKYEEKQILNGIEK